MKSWIITALLVSSLNSFATTPEQAQEQILEKQREHQKKIELQKKEKREALAKQKKMLERHKKFTNGTKSNPNLKDQDIYDQD